MKKMLIFAALLLALPAMSQELKFKLPLGGTPRPKVDFVLPDSLAHMMPWSPDYKTMEPITMRPSVSMTSVVVIPEDKRSSRTVFLDNNMLYLGRHFVISNGQARNRNPFGNNTFNRSPFPDAYLDARTLSFPIPR